MRTRARAGSVVVVWLASTFFAPGALAQIKPWTVEEATIAALLPLLASAEPVPTLARAKPAGPGAALRIADYVFARAGTPATAGDGLLFYAWPAEQKPLRAFAATDAGSAMWTADAPPYGGPDGPAWNAVVASGGKETIAQALTMPGKGMDGRMWLPVALEKPQALRVAVVDRDGRPLDYASVAIGPESWVGADAAAIDGACAVGLVTTGADGTGTLASVPVPGARLAVASAGAFLPGTPKVARTERGLAITVDADVAKIAAGRLARRNANESAAIATLKNISSAQAQMQACAAIDANQNGAGEHGFFGELSGAAALRAPASPFLAAAAPAGEVRLVPPVLSGAFGNVRGSCVVRSGYVFQMWLPGEKGWVAERPTGGGAGVKVHAARSEVIWCAYAWPVSTGVSGRRAFFVNQTGDVLAAEVGDARYGGLAKRPAPDAAYTGPDPAAAVAAANREGNDGLQWKVVN